MKRTLPLLAIAIGLALPILPASAQQQMAQIQFGVCGVPPLPPCERPRDRRDDDRRGPPDDRRGGPYTGRPADDDDLGVVCRTRTLQCRVGRPRPIGGRCTCEDEEGESVVGRNVR